ncbi:MAG: CsbD family protein [Chloroflexota bacterium]|nr:CsbD family protein [Chloroflexota bacterium]MDP9473036.1 CsbD family protein [Chloroflexota bacterium]
MTDQSRDRIEGNVDELTGRGKSAFGELTGDEQTQSEGQTDQATGKGKQALADVKDKVDDVVKKVTNG